jgi:uncharacterized protein YciI
MKYVLFYEASEGSRSKVAAHIEAHRALWKQFHTVGQLLMIGPFTDAPPVGWAFAMGIFTNRAAAERFVKADPFVTHGLVARSTIREWNEALTP